MKNEKYFFYRTMVPPFTAKDFDANGLRWPVSHLSMIYPEIALWPLPLMAEYVDRVVFEIITNAKPQELEILLSNIKQMPIEIESLNATSIGNLGFVATYSPDPKLSAAAYQHIMRIRAKMLYASQQLEPVFKKPFAEA